MASIDTIADTAIAAANNYAGIATNYTSAAALIGDAGAVAPVAKDYYTASLAGPTSTEPAVYIPTTLDKTVISAEFDRIYNLLVALATNTLTSFLTTYFPLTNDAYDEATAWLVNTITNGGTGINSTIEAQIWQRDRDRITSANLAEQNAVLTQFAARGFPNLPQGALAGQLQELRAKSIIEIAEASRGAAIKVMEIEIQNVRFAVEQSISAREKAIQTAIDYIKALMTAPDIASNYAFKITDQQAGLINAVANFYNARLRRDELTINAAKMTRDLRFQQASWSLDKAKAELNERVQAAVGSAGVAANVAQAAMSTLNAISHFSQSA
jgi:hypothetical protein